MKHQREIGDIIDMEDTLADRLIAAGVFVAIVALGMATLWYGGKTLVAGIAYAETNRATAECEKWSDEARVYPGYFLVGWQKEQCDFYGISIDAPLKNYSGNN